VCLTHKCERRDSGIEHNESVVLRVYTGVDSRIEYLFADRPAINLGAILTAVLGRNNNNIIIITFIRCRHVGS
jgi:hypothetical protein